MKLYFSIVILVLMTLSTHLMANQVYFSTAERGAENLYQAIEAKDISTIKKLFGVENIRLLDFNEVDKEDVEAFILAWQDSHTIKSSDGEHYYIEVGPNTWTFPVPLIKDGNHWIFDTITGTENIIVRRIGHNELSTMQTVLAYYDAQMEYAKQDHNHNGALEYAQKIKSSEGKKDGLFWETKPGETLSPLGSLLANKTPGDAYHGYYYKILTSQGSNASDGAYNYILGDKMIAGFSLVAWPSIYGETGVMSFMINHQGFIYEKNLGDTEGEEPLVEQFDPDSSWTRISYDEVESDK